MRNAIKALAVRHFRRVTLGLAVICAVFVTVQPATAQRAKSVSQATGYIQVIGDYRREIQESGVTRVQERSSVAFSVGTGFVISPHGYLVTNHHVIRDGEELVTDGDIVVKTTTKTSRIVVCLPDNSAPRGARVPCATASVYFSDPEMDLAVLHLGGSDLPYLALGDSDAVASGQAINVWGYPFGGKLEVGRDGQSDIAPSISNTSGSVAALRDDNSGELRFLQINTNVNLGNSGGPVVDQEGFVVGVVQSKLRDADGIAFAVPVNRVKTFLESHALDAAMNARRLRLGQPQTLEAKGVTLRLPDEIPDTSPFRARLEGASLPAEIEFRVDRVLTPWSLLELERALISSKAFEPHTINRFARLTPTDPDVVIGRAIGTSADGKREFGMYYAIVHLGNESLIARYVGPLTQLAYNESVLRASLLSLEANSLISGSPQAVSQLEWLSPSSEHFVAIPSGWLREPRAPMSCAGLPPAAAAVAASPREDFTVSLRAAIWDGVNFNPAQAAAACSIRRGALGQTSYAARQEWLGVSHVAEGVFIAVGPNRIIQLEAVAPESKGAYARAALEEWAKKLR